MIGTIVFYPNGIWGAGYAVATEPSLITQNGESSGGESIAAGNGPLYDLVDAKRTTIFTIDTSGETADPELDIDLSANITSSDFMVIDNHNMGTVDVDITFRYAAGDSSLTPASCHSGPLGLPLSVQVGGPGATHYTINLDGILLEKHTAQTSANFNVLMDNGAATFAADITIGEWFVGKSFTPATAPEQPELISNFDGVIIHSALGGQKTSHARYGERKAWRLKWSYVSESDKDEFERVWQDTEGPRYPFYIDLGEESTPNLYFVRFMENSLRIRKLAAAAYEVSIMIESEV